jgi:UV DNA damage endonuclease
MRDCEGMEFDVMLEGKAKDISLLKLRPDLLRYAPDVATRFGITAAGAEELEAEEATLETEQSPAEVDEAA